MHKTGEKKISKSKFYDLGNCQVLIIINEMLGHVPTELGVTFLSFISFIQILPMKDSLFIEIGDKVSGSFKIPSVIRWVSISLTSSLSNSPNGLIMCNLCSIYIKSSGHGSGRETGSMKQGVGRREPKSPGGCQGRR